MKKINRMDCTVAALLLIVAACVGVIVGAVWMVGEIPHIDRLPDAFEQYATVQAYQATWVAEGN